MSHMSPLSHCLEVPKSNYGLRRFASSPNLFIPQVPIPHVPRALCRTNSTNGQYFSLVSRDSYNLSREYGDIRRQFYVNSPRTEYSSRMYNAGRTRCYLRPQTTNRYSHMSIYPMQDWSDRIGVAMDRMSWLARSMTNYKGSMAPETRYMLTPTYTYPLSTRLIQSVR